MHERRLPNILFSIQYQPEASFVYWKRDNILDKAHPILPCRNGNRKHREINISTSNIQIFEPFIISARGVELEKTKVSPLYVRLKMGGGLAQYKILLKFECWRYCILYTYLHLLYRASNGMWYRGRTSYFVQFAHTQKRGRGNSCILLQCFMHRHVIGDVFLQYLSRTPILNKKKETNCPAKYAIFWWYW